MGAIGVLDLDDLARRLATALRAESADAEIQQITLLPGGLSGITCAVEYLAGSASHRVVVKVATPGVNPTKNRDVLRQASVIKALGAVGDVPVPPLLFTDAGEPPAVPPFFVTAFVDGENFEPLETRDDTESRVSLTASALEGRYLHAADVLGRLHRTPAACLPSGVTPVDLETELVKWVRVLESVPEDLRADALPLGALLGSQRPTDWPGALVHGDYRLGNMICRGPEVAAVIDWEIWDVGDPRCDLAWFLHACDPDSVVARPGVAGIPSCDALISRYVAAGGPSPGDLSWFEALALYKRAAASALIVKHNRRAADPDPRKEFLAGTIPPLLNAARVLLR